jgi:leucyl-tRNA synthetase
MAVPAHDERDMEFAKKYNLAVSDAALVPADEVISKVGAKKVVSYRLRDWLISRQRYWGAPIPIVYDPDGRAHPVPEEHLPWLLPDDVEFTPKGYSPLEQSEKLKERTEKLFGKGWTPEVDTMDTFVCSSWYFFRFTDPKNKKEFASRDKIEQWIPVDLYVGGAEHTVLHLMYARFFTKVLHRLGYINFDEPFLKLRHQGLIGGANGRKMSKRYGNVVDPQDIVGNFGADTLRVYEMFIGPFEKGAFWQVDGIRGAHRFLGRVWGLVQNHESRIKNHESQNSKSETLYPQPYTPDPNLRHKTIRKVTEDIETLNFNTAISALMEYLNALYENGYGEEDIKILLLLLAPFAPHITEELWSRLAGAENEGGEKLGEKGSIHNQNWPEFNAQLAKQEMITIPVQINGKLRAQIEVETDTDEEKLQKLALENEKIKLYLGSKKPKKMVVVKNKIVNIVL